MSDAPDHTTAPEPKTALEAAQRAIDTTLADEGKLGPNIMHFIRLLREAGLPLGPDQTLSAMEAVFHVGPERREDFYWTLHATLIRRHEHSALFDQAFKIFWRNPRLLERLLTTNLPPLKAKDQAPPPPMSRRLNDALATLSETEGPPAEPGDDSDTTEPPELEIDASETSSTRELLQLQDFEAMSQAEWAAAKRAIQDLSLPLKRILTRRHRPDAQGPRIDPRRTLRQSLRQGGGDIILHRQRRRERPPALVVLCDISGSMGRYTRMMLHFIHALTTDNERVHAFLFGTRLTNISRSLRHRDPDEALEAVTGQVSDWGGGTRIAAAIDGFNRHWARRVLAQGAIVLLITDGLEREAPEGLRAPMQRLSRSAKRTIWLNPLLRYDGFEARATSVQILLDYVDDFRPVHNLESMHDLSAALSGSGPHLWLQTARQQKRRLVSSPA